MVAKALALDVDIVVLDLEDGVPPDHKDAARRIVAAAIDAHRPGPFCFVRTQSSDRDAFACDLDAVIRPGLAGLVLPKVEQAQDLQRVDVMLAERESRRGLDTGAVRLVAIIENARGLIAAPAIAAACQRLIALLFGAEDFALDLGMPALRQGEAARMAYARSAVVVAAASQRLQAIDRVYLDVHDLDGLSADAHDGRQLGFTGKALIHPNQIDVVRKVFAPTAEQLAHARQIVAAFDQAWAKGVGSITVAGQLVDYPIAEQARRILDAYRSQR